MSNLYIFLFLVSVFSGGDSATFGCFLQSIPGLTSLFQCPADSLCQPWSYRLINGPNFWWKRYPTCRNTSQSPIDITPGCVEKNGNLAPLGFTNYDASITEAIIENNGHTIELIPEDGVERSIFVDGDTYAFQQLHFHWGSSSGKGSEHTIDGGSYAMEMHLVHRNTKGKIAVVGVMIQEQNRINDDLKPLTDELPNLKYRNETARLRSELNLKELLPENTVHFYRYSGSLTTPGCAEGVTWSVLKSPISVGVEQMKQFRALYSVTKKDAEKGGNGDCFLSNNYRPTQPLNGRKVYLSQ